MILVQPRVKKKDETKEKHERLGRTRNDNKKIISGKATFCDILESTVKQ